MSKFETNAIRAQAERSHNREHSVPTYMTSSFMFDDAEHMRAMFAGEAEGNIYSRYSNPNTDELVNKVCAMEGAEAGFTTASGMSAVFNSIVPFLKSGACRCLRLVSPRSCKSYYRSGLRSMKQPNDLHSG